MSNALPRYMYRDPAETLSRLEAGTVFQKEGCAACAWHRFQVTESCLKKMSPGRHWCLGFEEK